MANHEFFYFKWHARKLHNYGDVIHSFDWKLAYNTMVVFKMRDSVPSTRYSHVYNVLRLWIIYPIPTYRVYRLYDLNLEITRLKEQWTSNESMNGKTLHG